MIRDPSDGSVRDVTPEEDHLLRKALIASGTVVQPALDPVASGLPAPAAKDFDRHKRSREWLESRRKKPIETTLSAHYATHNLGFQPKEGER